MKLVFFGSAIVALITLAGCDDSTKPARLVATGVSTSGFVGCANAGEEGLRCWGELPGQRHNIGAVLEWQWFDVGAAHVCGIDMDERPFCWGEGGNGQLGNGGFADAAQPMPVALEQPVTQIGAGDSHTCAIASRVVYCWGNNFSGGLGRADIPGSAVPLSVDVPEASWITVGTGRTCAVTLTRQLYCWGANAAGEVGSDAGIRWLPDTLHSHLAFDAVSIVGLHACGLTPEGTVYCWGDDSRGQLGGSSVATSSLAPVDAPGAEEIAVGGAHSCLLDSSGSVWCWGANDHGQIGDGTFEDRLTPVRLTNLPPANTISAGLDVTCAVVRSGEVYCWGRGDFGQLGDSTRDSATPLRVDLAGTRAF